ncbi:MAG: hypothetical protein EXX96DRAFT_555975 [Benjaminiella poitrasii]|nr:MAG: hypothetical protein EXX96DRAFT_555975 [Benjaminiella poitrasii]
MLRPQYTRKPFEILLIGPGNAGKRTLAAQLLKTRDVFYSIRIAEKLPRKDLDHVDFIFIVVDMTQVVSLDLLEQILKRVNTSYLANKTAVITTKMDMMRFWQIELESIQKLIEIYLALHLFYANLKNPLENSRVCGQLSRLVKASTSQYRNVDLALLKTVQVYNMDTEEEEGEETVEQEQETVEQEQEAQEQELTATVPPTTAEDI